jgi:hypothetical protein
MKTSLLMPLALFATASLVQAEPRGFAEIEGRRLLFDGREYRAVGVNMPNLSQGYLGTWFHWQEIHGTREAMREAIVAGVREAAECEIAFIRFFANPGYPKDTAELYLRDRDAYWRGMDELFQLCAEHDIRLVPCLSSVIRWHSLYREPLRAITDPESQTHKAAYAYIREFVSRYRDDPTVLMWELDNEAFLRADVDLDGFPALPAGVYPDGAENVRTTYTRADSLRFEDLVQVYRDMTTFIKDLDPNHPVTSGDAGVREESMSRRLTFPDFRYRADTLREHLANLLLSQPLPLDVFSIHSYGNGQEVLTERLDPLEYLRARVQAFHAARAPVFIGELGQEAPAFQSDPSAEWTCRAIDLLEEEEVSLIAVWVWHFPWQDKDHNIPSAAAQPRLVERIRSFNRRYARP